jgi:hypothetical protein
MEPTSALITVSVVFMTASVRKRQPSYDPALIRPKANYEKMRISLACA